MPATKLELLINTIKDINYTNYKYNDIIKLKKRAQGPVVLVLSLIKDIYTFKNGRNIYEQCT